jgi:hypothetical protein
VKTIGDNAFMNCTSLRSATLPASATGAGDGIFVNCTRLQQVTFANGTRVIPFDTFDTCTNLIRITIPATVTNIGASAFARCIHLKEVYFNGNAPVPSNDSSVFDSVPVGLGIYYFPGATGWGSTFDGVPAWSWSPSGKDFSFTTSNFAFTITGPPIGTVVVEATTNLSNPNWQAISTNTINDGTSSFLEPQIRPSRFYRFRTP